MRTFRVYFDNGNQLLFDAPSVREIVEYCDMVHMNCEITKIEEVIE